MSLNRLLDEAATLMLAEYDAETRFRLRWFDERWRWVSSRATPRTAPDGTRSWFGVFTDISRQVELEERLARIETASSFPSP